MGLWETLEIQTIASSYSSGLQLQLFVYLERCLLWAVGQARPDSLLKLSSGLFHNLCSESQAKEPEASREAYCDDKAITRQA
jgi:hypothetical protein